MVRERVAPPRCRARSMEKSVQGRRCRRPRAPRRPAKSTSACDATAHRHGVVERRAASAIRRTWPRRPLTARGNRSAPAFGRFAQRPRAAATGRCRSGDARRSLRSRCRGAGAGAGTVVADARCRNPPRSARCVSGRRSRSAHLRRCGARSAPARRRRARDRCRLRLQRLVFAFAAVTARGHAGRPAPAGAGVRPMRWRAAFCRCRRSRPTTTTGRDALLLQRGMQRSAQSRSRQDQRAPPVCMRGCRARRSNGGDASPYQNAGGRRRRAALTPRPVRGTAPGAGAGTGRPWPSNWRACPAPPGSRPSSSTSTRSARFDMEPGGARSPAWSGPASGGRARPAPGRSDSLSSAAVASSSPRSLGQRARP